MGEHGSSHFASKRGANLRGNVGRVMVSVAHSLDHLGSIVHVLHYADV